MNCTIECEYSSTCNIKDVRDNCSLYQKRPCYKRDDGKCVGEICINYGTENCKLNKNKKN